MFIARNEQSWEGPSLITCLLKHQPEFKSEMKVTLPMVFGNSGISAISKLGSNRISINDFPNFFIEETKKYDNDLMVSWVKNL